MKKIFLLCLALLTFVCANAEEVKVVLKPHGPIVSNGEHQFPRNPVEAPDVYLDSHTLLFDTVFGDDIVVQLLDPDTMEDDVPTVVYATTLTAGDDEITLPSSYTGEYGIRLVVGNWYFWGYVNL